MQSCTLFSPITWELFVLVTNYVKYLSFNTCKITEKYLEILWLCFQVVLKENPSECITGTPTAHHFLIGLCAFMVFFVSNLDWEPQNAN